MDPRVSAYCPKVPRRRQSGFGLLEVIVAFAVMAIAGATLFSWINQSLATAVRLERVQDEAQLSLTAQALLAGVNPMQEPTGEREQAQVRVRWRSEPLAPPREGPPGAEGQALGIWMVALFNLHVEASDRHSGVDVAFDLPQVGFSAKPGALGAMEALRGSR